MTKRSIGAEDGLAKEWPVYNTGETNGEKRRRKEEKKRRREEETLQINSERGRWRITTAVRVGG